MITVVKLGGSLLDLPDLHARWTRFVQVEHLTGRILLIVGGGNIVEAVRHYDTIHGLNHVQSHWLCVDLMNSTAGLLSQLLQGVTVLTRPEQLDDWITDQSEHLVMHSTSLTAIVAPSAFYHRQLRSECLPIGWQTTSDAISGLLSSVVGATQLILLKSTEASSEASPLLDDTFKAQWAESISWRTVNLRSEKYG